MSSDEFRVTQHVMKTIKDEMPAIVRSMVSIFLIFSLLSFSFWVASIPLIFINPTLSYKIMMWLPDQICYDILPDEDCHDCGRSHLCSDQVHTYFINSFQQFVIFKLVLWKKYLWQNSPNLSVVNLGFALTYIRSNLLELGYWPRNDLSGK